MQFIDEARTRVVSGAGGRGCVSFLREKHRPRGGPAGGDGGRGGDVVIVAREGHSTLIEFRYKNQFKAKRGQHGKGKSQHGASAPDVLIPVPAGTVIEDEESGQLLCELLTRGQIYVAAKGGRGGRGNARFATPTNRAPRHAEEGEPGQERCLKLTLKLLADVGLAGYPNSGKSSLLARVSAAHPKIAPYPFSTLVPLLGMVRVGEYESFVLADIPGLIEGAHRGAGLGSRFLRHIERTRVLIHILDLSDQSGRDPLDDFHKLNRELKLYDPALAGKPQVVAPNKIDLLEAREKLARIEEHFQLLGMEVFPISALTGEGIEALIKRAWEELVSIKGTA